MRGVRGVRAKKRRTRARSLALALVASQLVAGAAHAQSRTGFAVNRFEPAERGSGQFVVDSLDLRAGSAAAGATFDYAYKPLVVYDATGAERYALVRHQTMLHLGGSFVLAGRLRLGLDAPVALYQDGESATIDGITLSPSNAPAFGDVRLAADVRVAGEYGGPFTLALGARGWLPTGLRSQFTSDGSARVAPQVLASGAIDVLAWAARVAIVVRSRDDTYAGRALGSELFAAVGAGIRTRDQRLFVGPELALASTFTSGAKFLGSRETPAELLLGAHYDVLPNLRAGAGVGAGIGHGYGSPVLRGLASLEWVTSAPARKRQSGEAPEGPTPWEGYEGGGGAPPPTSDRPLAVVTENEIRIEEELRFATDSAELLAGSDAVLGAVKRVLDEHPEIRRLRIEGHTDSVGEPAYNDELSARRAAAVEAWLVGHGIAKERLESAGLGSREPIDTNETEAGRAKNRRVVFRILER
jgi:outer membrane protein OmpA-like peptidoglycan-associated protein